MFTAADKVSKHVTAVQKQSAQPFFARKHSDAFFSGSEKVSPASFIQPKLSVSHPEDAQEKEADSMANKVMTMPETTHIAAASEEKDEVNRKDAEREVQRMEMSGLQLKDETEEVQRAEGEQEIQRREGDETTVQRVEEKQDEKVQTKLFAASGTGTSNHIIQAKCDGCEEKKVDRKIISLPLSYAVQRSSRGPPADQDQPNSFEQNLQNTRGTGSPLPGETLSFMESRFSADFSGVRIHNSDTAVQMNKDIHAQAFTYGNDIYFNSGKFSPSSTEGRTLLAHELTHTIQQGASSHVSSPASDGNSGVAPKQISRKLSIQRSASNLNTAVGYAKAEQGKVIANKEGADGFRFGWQQLMEYFKTTLGAEKILPDGASGDATTVPQANIKKKNTAKGVNIITPDGKLAKGDRDAMPSWCGIFAFWALNKAGLPMKKWLLGSMTIPPEAALAPGQAPPPGYIAYRNLRSHYGLVSSTSGSKVSTVNGNTAGSDNLGGEIQEQTHDLSEWTAFIDPMKLIEGSIRNPESGVEGKPKSFRELQKELFNVHRKENEGVEHEGKDNEEKENEGKDLERSLQRKLDSAESPSIADTAISGSKEIGQEELQRKEDAGEDEKTINKKELIHTSAAGASSDKKEELQRSEDDSVFKKEIDRKSGDSSPPLEKEIRRKEQAKEQEQFVQKMDMIHSAANSSPPEKEIQQKEQETQENHVQTKDIVHAAGDSSPPIEQEEKSNVQRKSEPKVQRLFGWVSDAIDWVGDKLDEGKKWVLEKVTKLIINVRGYKALRVVLGKDPISGEHVERNGYNFIDAAIDIMPFGSLIKEKLQELGILEQAAKFAEKLFGRVETLISGIYDTFANFIDSLSLSDLKNIPAVFSRLENAFTSFFNQVISFAKGVAKDFVEFVKKALLIPLGRYIKTKTEFWDLLCLIIGKDPLTDEPKQPTGANILNAVLGLSEWGIEQRKKMQETGTFNKVAAWIDKGISVFSKAYDMLKAAFAGLWNFVSIEALMHPIDTFLKIFDSFSQPIVLVGKFFIDAGIAILKIVKEVLFKWISDKGKETKGYYLVTVLISKDPFTGVRVPRTTENLIKGFMLLSEGGEEQFDKMKESGAIDRATAKIDAAVSTLGFTWAYVKGLFTSLWESFTWKDLLLPLLAFAKIIETFKNPVLRLIRFVISIIVALFEVILRMMGFPIDLVFKLIENVKLAWASIKSNPTGFLMNLLRAIKQGFSQFFDNILTHLWNGLKAWLQQELQDGGVPMPVDYTAMGIIKWLLVILDITMEKIWKKLETRVGKEKVDKMRALIAKAEAIYEKANEAMVFIEDVRQRGMEAIVDKIKEKLNNVWEMVLGAIQSFIMDTIIKKVTTKLLSMLDPTGIMAVINSAIALYKAIQSFFKYLEKILGIVNSFVEGIIEICTGNIVSAANFLERSLANGIPVVIGFLANQVGLDLSGRIREVLGAVREKVDQGLDFLIDKLVTFIEKLIAKGKEVVAKLLNWWKSKKEFTAADNKTHKLYFEGEGESAVLTMRSDPTPYTNFLEHYESQLGESGNEKVKVNGDEKTKLQVIAAGKAVAGDIEKEKRKKVKEYTGKDEDEQKANKAAAIDSLLGKLAEISKPFFGDDADKPKEPEIVPIPAANTNDFAKTQEATKIWKVDYVKKHGSGPDTSAKHTIYDKIDFRQKGDGSYYIRGHLINDNLGGPGKWSNMTALSRTANHEHEEKVESKVKAAFDAGAVIRYKVTTSGKQNVKKATVNDKDKFTKIADFAAALPYLEQITEAESQIPDTLSWEAYTMKKEGTEWKDDKEIVSKSSLTFDVSDFSEYEIGDLGGTITLDINKLKTEAKASELTFIQFRDQDKTHERSIQILSATESDELKKVFEDRDREKDKAYEFEKVENITGNTTFEVFKSNRAFYKNTSAEFVKDQNEIESKFKDKQNEIKLKLRAKAKQSELDKIDEMKTATDLVSWSVFKGGRVFYDDTSDGGPLEVENEFKKKVAELNAAPKTI